MILHEEGDWPIHFGKYKGTELRDIPDDYLEELFRDFNNRKIDMFEKKIYRYIDKYKVAIRIKVDSEFEL